jgi:plastocyanin
MRLRPLLVIGGLFAVITIAIFLSSCGGGSSSTSPGTGGGGGGSGPSFDLSFPATGASRSFTFATAGTWNYQCSPHGNCCGMTGSVVVNAGATEDSAVVTVGPGNTLSYSPATVTVKPGGTVRWVNASSATNHTVTR